MRNVTAWTRPLRRPVSALREGHRRFDRCGDDPRTALTATLHASIQYNTAQSQHGTGNRYSTVQYSPVRHTVQPQAPPLCSAGSATKQGDSSRGRRFRFNGSAAPHCTSDVRPRGCPHSTLTGLQPTPETATRLSLIAHWLLSATTHRPLHLHQSGAPQPHLPSAPHTSASTLPTYPFLANSPTLLH